MMTDLQITHSPNQLIVLNKFRKRIAREKYINNYASIYYGSMQNRFIVPGILITGICSIASFLTTSEMLNSNTKMWFNVGVGVLTAGSTILQSVASSFAFALRKDAFQKAADAYDDLVTKIEFEICNPNEKFIDFCNSLEDSILKIKTDCVFLPPLFIIAKYESEIMKTNLKLDDELQNEETFENLIIKQIINSKNTNDNKSINTTDTHLMDFAFSDTKIDITSLSNTHDLEYDEHIEPIGFANIHALKDDIPCSGLQNNTDQQNKN